MNLKLKGVVIRGRSRSFAVIQDGASRKEDIYYVDDTLQNARIAKILPDQVILSVNDRQEALLLFAATDRPGPAGRGHERPHPVRSRLVLGPGGLGSVSMVPQSPSRSMPYGTYISSTPMTCD